MPTTITMPQMGESVVEGVILRWLKQEGDRIVRDEPLLEIMTDKVNAELPAYEDGTLLRILAHEGDKVPVGGPLAEFATASEMAGEPEGTHQTKEAASVPNGRRGEAGATGTAAPFYAPDDGDAPHRRYSPLVRRLGQIHHVELDRIQGTGLEGRVTKADVLAYVAQRDTAAATQARREDRGKATPLEEAPAMAAAPWNGPAPSEATADTYLPLTPMRRAIAEHMVRSKSEAPHATTVHEVDVTGLVAWREANKEAFRAHRGFEITILAFIAGATCAALREFPILNSEWGEEAIVLKKEINLGIAVALDQGLIVPVIRNADERNYVGLARAIADLAQRARANSLDPSEVQGGTFTITNVGMFGSIVSMPVINAPQAAILATQAIGKRVVVQEDNSLAIRSMMYLSLSFDHRIIDGMTACRFMQSIGARLQSMDPGAIA